MNEPLVIGITGNIGSGKSTVAILLEQAIEEAGGKVAIVDADEIVRALQRHGQPGWRAVVEEFGTGVLDPVSEEIDREALARVAFASNEARMRLNKAVHPLVRLEERRQIDEAQAEGAHVLLVVPLLFETGLEEWCDVVVVVTVPDTERFRRLQESRGMEEEAVRVRMAGQMPEQEMMRRAGLVIDNAGDLKALRSQVRETWQMILSGEWR